MNDLGNVEMGNRNRPYLLVIVPRVRCFLEILVEPCELDAVE